MSYRLKVGVFKVRCREPGCPFFSEFVVKENIMGATEADVDSEALKIARNLGFIKHDALYGRKHQLANPDVTKASATYERMGGGPVSHPAAPAAPAQREPAVPTRTYARGEVIIRKGESAVTVCEVVRGSALNEKLPDMVYKAGSTFGSAAIFRQKNRMADIVAGEDGTAIAFYNIRELSRTNPAKARELYDEAMEDLFHILGYLEDYAASLEKKVRSLEAKKAGPAKAAAKPAAKSTAAKKAAKKPAPRKAAAKKAPAKKKKR
jgi:CRP-like cAMP-binding protein